MARPSTAVRVYDAVLELAASQGVHSLTIEGIAAQAGVGKQTLYRSWGSVPAILFDALLAYDGQADETLQPGTGDLQDELDGFLRAAIEEISTEPRETLLRCLAARIQEDAQIATEFHDLLFRPQLRIVHSILQRGGVKNVERTAELLLAPIFYRWFLRLPPIPSREVAEHVARVLLRDV